MFKSNLQRLELWSKKSEVNYWIHHSIKPVLENRTDTKLITSNWTQTKMLPHSKIPSKVVTYRVEAEWNTTTPKKSDISKD